MRTAPAGQFDKLAGAVCRYFPSQVRSRRSATKGHSGGTVPADHQCGIGPSGCKYAVARRLSSFLASAPLTSLAYARLGSTTTVITWNDFQTGSTGASCFWADRLRVIVVLSGMFGTVTDHGDKIYQRWPRAGRSGRHPPRSQVLSQTRPLPSMQRLRLQSIPLPPPPYSRRRGRGS